jgi:hypothetical protein
MNVFFKFKPGVAAADRRKILRAVRNRAASSATRLFPDTEVKELTAHYMVECRLTAEASALVGHLSSLPEIEYAQIEVKRSIQ